jgi:hypothetical protein
MGQKLDCYLNITHFRKYVCMVDILHKKSSMRLHVYEGQLSGTPKTFIPSKGVKSKSKGQEPLKKSKKESHDICKVALGMIYTSK